SVHMGTLQGFIEVRQGEGVKSKSINLALGVVRHILNLAASDWRDENNLTWLAVAPKIKLLKVTDARAPYPLSWCNGGTAIASSACRWVCQKSSAHSSSQVNVSATAASTAGASTSTNAMPTATSTKAGCAASQA